jgi:uncharacterized protein YndB with AHSA1/START domain
MVEDVTSVIEIAAPRERVWEALTDPRQVARWMGCLQFRAEVGHVFYLQPHRERRAAGDVTDAIACRLEILDRPRRLAFGWTFPDTADTHVDIRVREIPGGAHVRLVHSGWDQFDERETAELRDGLGVAWHSVALPALKAVVEGSKT